MKPNRHIKKIINHLHKMTVDGHIDKPDKYVALNDVELAVHKLQQAFDNEIGFGKSDKPDVPTS